MLPNSDVFDLQERTRARNRSVFLTPLDWGGALEPIRQEAVVLNTLGLPMIEGYMAVTDELFEVKDYQRDRLIQLEYDKQESQKAIADADAATERRKLAIKYAAERELHLARLYDARVRALVMGAKEYAAEVEREAIELEKLKAILAVAKQEARLKEINAEIYLEYVKRMEVEVDIARAELDAAKTNTRALLADIAAEEAELDVIEADLKEAMMVAEKATLQADIAAIYAAIIIKRLAEVKLDVEKAEIAAGFKYIQTKLDDLLDIWEVRTRTENLKLQSEQQVYDEVLRLLDSDRAAEALRLLAMTYDEQFMDYEEGATDAELDKEQELTDRKVAARKDLMRYKTDVAMELDDYGAWAKLIANAAQRWVNKNRVTWSYQGQDMSLKVDKEE